jgi:hypothetical protein
MKRQLIIALLNLVLMVSMFLMDLIYKGLFTLAWLTGLARVANFFPRPQKEI